MIWFWIVAVIVFGVVEMVTVGLVSIWFAVGSVAAFIAATLGCTLQTQILTFVLVSAFAVILMRPLVRNCLKKEAIPTNLDRVLGKTARVVETIDPAACSGAVFIDGKTWTARSVNGTEIPEGSSVLVKAIDGVKLMVTEA